MAPKFGTSGLRGLVVELTPDLIADHIHAFLKVCPIGSGLYVARDLRPSSPDIAAVVIDAARKAGIAVTDCGDVPTPALALASMSAGAAAVMITGSHIPADRNGLKFYLPHGEIDKADETRIVGALGQEFSAAHALGALSAASVGAAWVARYVDAFGAQALAGLKIGIWSHSAVSRDLLLDTFRQLGAEVIELDRSDSYIPVDTEAVPTWAREKIAAWCQEHTLDALVSTDGDGDRPLLADATGRVIPGDILGQITARVVGAKHVATPVSSNSGVELSGSFAKVSRTKIGSPFVIAAMAELGGKVVGYEANGGFLLGFEANLPNGPLSPLATRDSLLPLIAPLSLARRAGGMAALVTAEPPRVTAADRLEDITTETSKALIAGFQTDPAKLQAFLNNLGEDVQTINETDGLRVSCTSGRIVHFRPSGNAPELRLYIEAESIEVTEEILRNGLLKLKFSLVKSR